MTNDPADPAASEVLRVAIVGAGPAGLYTADALTFDDARVRVDLLERLPVPFGLLRYGVAPDHLNIKAAGGTLQEVLERPAVQLLCNVRIGEDVSVAELRHHYDAVVYAVGASRDRRLGIPGEDLPGSGSATSFVSWYNGHPEQPPLEVIDAVSVAVIGVGNVALDVARMLLKDPEELLHTDMPQPVIDVLRASTVTDVHVIGRRGAEHAKFTTKELRELGELRGVDVVIAAEELPPEDPPGARPPVTRNLAVLREWASRPGTGATRRLHLHFQSAPVELLGAERVQALRLERTTADDSGGARPTGSLWDLPCDLVLRSVGYRSLPLPGVPFDEATGTIPSSDGRVLRDGQPRPGEYVAGWVGRGATGILGTNRADGSDTATRLHEDLPLLLARRTHAPEGIAALLHDRGVSHVDVERWTAIAHREGSHGAAHGRGRVKLTDWGELLQAAGIASGRQEP